jgi:hypothetical protein
MTLDRPPIADGPQDLSPQWLEAALRTSGLDVRVAAIRTEPVGTGQMAHNERLFVEYEGEAADAPRTFVAKLPSPDETSRAAGGAGAYRTEVLFYTELAETLAIRTPACFFGAVSEDATRFTLLLEDLAPARQGDQIEGASDAQIESAVVNLAGLHAPRWNDPALGEIDWLTLGASPVMAQFVRGATPAFLERYAERISSADADVLAAFAEGAERWIETQPEDRTLVHGDYRLDNLLFATDEGGLEVAAVDWQTLSVGSGGRDLAYLLGNSSPPDRRRAHEDHMLEVYRRAMSELGAEVTAEQVRHSYRHGCFQGPMVSILGAIAVGRTERGDAMFMAMIERCVAQIRDMDALALLAGS